VGRYRFRPRLWTLERVVAEIQALHASGELGSSSALVDDGHGDLVGAAQRYAGSWGRALELAGLAYQPRPRWTPESVLAAIRKRHRRKESLAASQVENGLLIAAVRRFGSWRKARELALPAYDQGNVRWTRPRLIQALRQRHTRKAPIDAKSVRADESKLVSAAIRLFGSWAAALQAAIPSYEPPRRWTKELVKREIHALSARGASLSAGAMRTSDPGLLKAAHELFGGWPEARDAAGVWFSDRPPRGRRGRRRRRPQG
jgi:hypothetical protein